MHDPEVLRSTARRLLDLHLAGTTQLADEVYENPMSVYMDEDRFRREVDVFFRANPVILGLSCELTEPGAFKTLDVGGTPVLVVRSDDGSMGAYLNVCRHRGAEVATGSGCARRFTCKYHAWVYDTRGALVGLPGAAGFEGMDRSTRGLVALPVEERHGFIFGLVDPEGTLDLDAHLGPLDAELPELRVDELTHVGTRELPAACGWHVAMDTHTESYHFTSLHANSIAPFTSGNLNVVDTFGTSQRLGFGASSLPTLADVSEEEWDPTPHVQFVYLLFPNNSFLVTNDHCELFQIFPGPGGIGTSITYQSYFNRVPLDSDAVRGTTEFMFDMFHAVVRDEDYPCAEEIQAGLASGANTHLVFGRNEPALHHLHRSYDEVLSRY